MIKSINYMEYKIYKLTHKTLGTVYVGRTKMSFKKRRNTGYRKNPELMKIIDDCEYILIENTNDKQREQYWIEKLINDGVKLLNKYKNNYDEKQYKKIYYSENKDRIKEYMKSYVRREDVIAKKREYDNKRDRKEYNRLQYLKRKKLKELI